MVQLAPLRVCVTCIATCVKPNGSGARKMQQLRAERQTALLVADDEQAAIKAESCDDCGTYLKFFIRKKNRKLKPWQMTSPLCTGRANGARRLRPQFHQPVPFPGEGE